MTVAMVLTTAISLGLVGTGLLAVRTIDRTEQLYSDRVEVQVALTSDVSAADTDCSQPVCAALRHAGGSPLVASVRYENQQEAYERYKQLFAGQALADVVRPQSLPATLRVRLADQEAGARPCAQAMTGQVGVRNVIDQRDVVARLFDFLGGVRNVTFALAAGAGDRGAAADLQHRAGLGVHPAHRGRRDAAGRRHPLVHPAAVPDRGGGHRRGRRADRGRAGCWRASSCSSTSCSSGIVSNGVVPPIEVGDVLWVSPILFMIGAGIASVTGYVTLRLYVAS